MRFLKRWFGKAGSRRDKMLARILDATERFRSAAERSRPPHSRLFWDLAAASVELHRQVRAHPEAIGRLRRFLVFHLPRMARYCEDWARLAEAEPLQNPDASAIADFQTYLQSIRDAAEFCISQRHDALHATLAALETQLDRENF